MPDQGTRWGVAIPAGDHSVMHVERFADHEHAEAVADRSPFVRTLYIHPITGAVCFGEVYPLVHSDDGCASWHYSATGWAVPLVEASR
ncbi:MAG: hypothetical protein ACRDUW_20240 [Pseudonocardiaceae bacterium]